MAKIQTLAEMLAENPNEFKNPVRTKQEEEMLHRQYLERKAQETSQRIETPRPEYDAGRKAFEDGEPYSSKMSEEWQAGWIEAEEDSEE